MGLEFAVGCEVLYRGDAHPELIGRRGRVLHVDGRVIRVGFYPLPDGRTPILDVPAADVGVSGGAE